MTQVIDGEFATTLTQRYGSPLYAYDLDVVTRRVQEIGDILPARARLFYSLKANPLPEIGAALRKTCAAEVSSTGELAAALEAGFDCDRILYTGPGKTTDAIHAALRAGVQHFSCESWREAERLARIAGCFGVRPRVLLRVNPSLAPRADLSMSRGAGQFGIAEEELTDAPDEWNRLRDTLEVLGVHVYLGTQVHDVAALEAGFRAAVDTAHRISVRLSLALRVIDVGGGFPWPFATLADPPRLDGLQPMLAHLCSAGNGTADTEFWFESGRYLCASAGTLIATVIDDKVGAGGRRYVVLDVGINALGGMAGLGRLLTSAMTFIPISPTPAGPATRAEVVGPSCTPLDLLARDVLLPPLSPDGLIAIPNVGAYGLTAGLLGFLSQPVPAEAVYRGVQVSGARRLVLHRERMTCR
jgi:diaminopimelate decarboxylase